MARLMLLLVAAEGKVMAEKKKVTLIEDYEVCRDILATIIRSMDYAVILPRSKAAAEKANVIVVYLDFSQMRGLDTISALRADRRTKDIPIIVYVPWGHDEAAVAALDAGANHVVNDPITVDALEAGIAKYAPRPNPFELGAAA